MLTFLNILGLFISHLTVIEFWRYEIWNQNNNVKSWWHGNFYAKDDKDKEDLSSLLEEIVVIGEFCLYYVGPDILLCWEANTIEKIFSFEETKYNNKSDDQNTLEQKQLEYLQLRNFVSTTKTFTYNFPPCKTDLSILIIEI